MKRTQLILTYHVLLQMQNSQKSKSRRDVPGDMFLVIGKIERGGVRLSGLRAVIFVFVFF